MNQQNQQHQPSHQQPVQHQGYSQHVPQSHYVVQQVPMRRADRNRMTAIVLALLLGGLGAHKFYLGQGGLGVVYILFCLTFIPAIVALVEVVMYLSMSDAEFDRKYNY